MIDQILIAQDCVVGIYPERSTKYTWGVGIIPGERPIKYSWGATSVMPLGKDTVPCWEIKSPEAHQRRGNGRVQRATPRLFQITATGGVSLTFNICKGAWRSA